MGDARDDDARRTLGVIHHEARAARDRHNDELQGIRRLNGLLRQILDRATPAEGEDGGTDDRT